MGLPLPRGSWIMLGERVATTHAADLTSLSILLGDSMPREHLGMPRSWVADEATHERESTRIFSKAWVYAAHCEELGETGIKRIDLDGHQLILVKDDEERVRCFRNFCRHRGCLLVEDAEAIGSAHRIQCPYHAWTYDRTGQLLSAPNMQSGEDFDPNHYGLETVACESWCGLVFIKLGQSGPSLAEYLRPLDEQLQPWTIADLRLEQSLEYDVQANWKILFQNYNECYHCPTVHPALNRLSPYRGTSNDFERGSILGGPMALAPDIASMSTDGSAVGPPLPGLTQDQRRIVGYYTVQPNLFVSPHPDYVMLHRLERKAIDHTRVVCQFLFHPRQLTDSAFEPTPAIDFWDTTNRQDWRVCELTQQGMTDRAYRPGPYSQLEQVSIAFEQEYRRQMEFVNG